MNKEKTVILIKLSKGTASREDLRTLLKFYESEYKKNNHEINSFIEWQCYVELFKRLTSSVLNEDANSLAPGFIKYCISGEYHNTKLFVKTIKTVINMGLASGNITDPVFFGQPDPGYKIDLETVVHIIIRHNESINHFVNDLSKSNGHNPSSFGFGVLAEPMLLLLMALNVIKDEDWITPSRGHTLICHFRNAGNEYTIVRKRNSKEIITFYPRNDNHVARYIEFERDPDEMAFIRK